MNSKEQKWRDGLERVYALVEAERVKLLAMLIEKKRGDNSVDMGTARV